MHSPRKPISQQGTAKPIIAQQQRQRSAAKPLQLRFQNPVIIQMKRPPAPPPVYRPQSKLEVAQTKKSVCGGQNLLQRNAIVLTHRPVTLSLAGRRANDTRRIIQRMESGTGSSGRPASTLWGLFSQYRYAQANEVVDAFFSAGYTVDDAPAAIGRAIQELHLDLPAHGTGGSDSGVQGDLDEAAGQWVTKLSAWARNHPKASSSNSRHRGLQHTDEQARQAQERKVERKDEKADEKHRKWHDANPGKKCTIGGCRM